MGVDKTPRRQNWSDVSASRGVGRCGLNTNLVFIWLREDSFNIGSEDIDIARLLPIEVAEPTANIEPGLPDDLYPRVGLPEESTLNNGSEGMCKTIFDGSERSEVRLRFIEPGRPVQNHNTQTGA